MATVQLFFTIFVIKWPLIKTNGYHSSTISDCITLQSIPRLRVRKLRPLFDVKSIFCVCFVGLLISFSALSLLHFRPFPHIKYCLADFIISLPLALLYDFLNLLIFSFQLTLKSNMQCLTYKIKSWYENAYKTCILRLQRAE